MPERGLVIVPTYNEKDNVSRIIPAILSQHESLDVLVVDDGSPDGTGKLVDEIASTNARVHALHRSGKLGLGTAYIAGFKWGLERGYDYMFEMDADFSHSPDRLPGFLEAVKTADLVIGSRYQGGRVNVVNWPMSRLLLSYFANIYARIVTGLRIADTTAGYRCYRRHVLSSIDFDHVRSNGYAFQIEMTFRTWRKGFRIVEIPIVFVDRLEGSSKMSKKIVREAMWMVWRLRWWQLTKQV